MKIIRYHYALETRWGILDGDTVHDLEGGLEAPRRGEARHTLSDVTLLAPCEPRQVISLGANYADRCRENNLPIPEEPALHDTFRMPGEDTVVGPEAVLRLPPWEGHVEYGAELGVVIGRPCHGVGPDRIDEYILGYTCLNNLWAKTRPRVPGAMNIRVYDSFCPVGPWIETELDPSDLAIKQHRNGEFRQDSRTSAMLFPIQKAITFLARHIPLAAGDLVMTGTPGGVALVEPGDRLEVEIEGIGTLANTVVADPAVRRRQLERMSA